MSISRTIMSGRISQGPEIRYTQDGVAVTRFTLAVDRPFGKEVNGKKPVDFHKCVVFRQFAEVIANNCVTGQVMYVEGRLQNRTWDDRGENRTLTELVVENADFGEKPRGKREESGERSFTEQSAAGFKRMDTPNKQQQNGFVPPPSDSDLPF